MLPVVGGCARHTGSLKCLHVNCHICGARSQARCQAATRTGSEKTRAGRRDLAAPGNIARPPEAPCGRRDKAAMCIPHFLPGLRPTHEGKETKHLPWLISLLSVVLVFRLRFQWPRRLPLRPSETAPKCAGCALCRAGTHQALGDECPWRLHVQGHQASPPLPSLVITLLTAPQLIWKD